MISNICKYHFLLLLLLPAMGANAQKPDTASILQMVKNDINGSMDLIYEYTMDAKFPNGSKDHVTGTYYLDADDKLLYNNSNVFTILYNGRWFYRADHKNKTLAIVDLHKEKNKMNGLKGKTIFKDGAFSGYFDTVLIRTAKVREMKYDGNIYRISFGFPESSAVKMMDVVYDTLKRQPVSTTTVMWQPLQMTENGMKSVEVSIGCSNFKKVAEKSSYKVDSFFSYENHKISLKKYYNYKLTTKI